MDSFLPNVESAQLKAQLNKIMAEVNAVTSDTSTTTTISAKGTEEAGQCIAEFTNFFLHCAERHGTTPHAVLGQHVVTNVFIFVLERIVKPNLLTYCKVAEKHASSAMVAATDARGTSASTGRRDALEARRRRLRGDIIRPFLQLFQSLHTSLIADGEPLTTQSGGGDAGARAGWEHRLDSLASGAAGGKSQQDAAVSFSTSAAGPAGNARSGRHQDSVYNSSGGASSFFSSSQTTPFQGVTRALDSEDGELVSSSFLASLSAAPLLWKNASPLNILCNHILEVLESQWLVAVVGADYATLFTEVLRWAGYARLVTPVYVVRMANCLVSLLERVPATNSGSGEEGSRGVGGSAARTAALAAAGGYAGGVPVDPSRRNGWMAGGESDEVAVSLPNMALRAVADGRVWTAVPNADDGCVYAQVLTKLLSLSQVSAAFPSASSSSSSLSSTSSLASPAAASTGAALGDDHAYSVGSASSRDRNHGAAMLLVQRLMDLVKTRHQTPTPDLRLEAYCIAALRQLCLRFHYDSPAVARRPVSLVKLLCDFFFLPHHTPRHDVWRLEVMQFLTVTVSYALADVVGEEMWTDLHHHLAYLPVSRASSSPESTNNTNGASVSPAIASQMTMSKENREVLALLHNSVFPTMCRVFTQHRHEYSFTSRRELFSFPCSPLQEVFDFGAVVLYLCSITHETHQAMHLAHGQAAAHGTHGNTGNEEGTRGAATANVDRQNGSEQRKRRREDIDVPDGASRREAATAAVAEATAAHTFPHPVQILSEYLTNEFFQATTTTTSSAGSAAATSTGTAAVAAAAAPSARPVTRRCAGAPPLVLKIRTAGIRTNTAAVQDVVSDASLFLLHLFAQPCATLRCPSCVADVLVEDVLLPLSAAFGLRMGPLLLFALRAVVPQCSGATQQFCLSLVAQRSLPPRMGVSLSSVNTWSTSVREDLLHPSEPNYCVLVTLLERRLAALQSNTPDALRLRFGERSTPATREGDLQPLDAVHVVWTTHLHTSVQRIVAQLQSMEHGYQQLREAALLLPPDTSEGDVHVTLYDALNGGTTTGHADSPLPAGADGSVLGITATTASSSSTAQSILSQLRVVPLLSCPIAGLLTRFATLTLCVRLAQLLGSFCDTAEVPTMDDGDAKNVEFMLYAAAHGANFYERVPVLNHQNNSSSDSTSHHEVWRENSTDGGAPRNAGGDTATQQKSRGTDVFDTASAAPVSLSRDAHLLFSSLAPSSSTLSTSSSSSSTNNQTSFLTLFSPVEFLTWLDETETYMCSLLWMHRARQQLEHQQRTPYDHHHTPTAGLHGGSSDKEEMERGGCGRRVRSSPLHGAVRGGVHAYLEAVCARLDDRSATLSDTMPAVLRDATEGQWMLRVPGNRRVRSASLSTESHRSQGEEGANSTAAGTFVEGRESFAAASPELQFVSGDAASPALPRTFQLMLALSAQRTIRWLMRRGEVLTSVEALLSEDARTSTESRKELNIGAARSFMHALRSCQSTCSLLFAVQCVQLLHVLLRWRRAGLWQPPTDEGEAEQAKSARSGRANTTANLAEEDDQPQPQPQQGAGEERSSAEAGAEGREYYSTTAAAARADRHLLSHSPHLFDHSTTTLDRFSVRGGGRLYYTVLWLCHRLTTLVRCRDVACALPCWTALATLYEDVGTALLDPALVCIDPSQTILTFTTAVASSLVQRGVRPLLQWRPTNPNSREVTRVVTSALNLSLNTLRSVLAASAQTNIAAYAAGQWMDAGAVRDLLLRTLAEQTLADGEGSATSGGGSTSLGPSELEDALLPSNHPFVMQKCPFLPPVLSALPAVLRLFLLSSLHAAESSQHAAVRVAGARENSDAGSRTSQQQRRQLADCCTVVRILQVLFARYRFHIGPAVCADLLGGPLADVDSLLRLYPHTDTIKPSASSSTFPTTTGTTNAAAAAALSASLTLSNSRTKRAENTAAAAAVLYTQAGRLLELWTAQLTDATRIDMPVCTPQWQCALLQSAFAVLVRCEPAVAEVLGRFSFEFLSGSTPYTVRRHAALQVGVLFRTFSARRAQVLHTLLVKAREGMLSATPMLCSTSLLALSDAVRAAPELRVDVLYTLLECWATRGFAQRGLVVECMTRLTGWAVEDGVRAVQSVLGATTAATLSLASVFSTLTGASPSTAGLQSVPHTSLCRLHLRPLLFLWLCEYRHPLVALPVACFGYATLSDFVVDQMPLLLPLALLLMTAADDGESAGLNDVRGRSTQRSGTGMATSRSTISSMGGAQDGLFQQILQMYTDAVLVEAAKKAAMQNAGTSTTTSAAAAAKQRARVEGPLGSPDEARVVEEARQLAPLCLVLQYVPAVVTQLLVIAANAPTTLFGTDNDSDFEGTFSTTGNTFLGGGSNAPQVDEWSRRAGQRRSTGVDAAARGRTSGTRLDAEESADVPWCATARKCLYWLEAMLNTCDEAALTQAGALVWLGRYVDGQQCTLTEVQAADGRALLRPAAAVSAAEALFFYVQRQTVWPTRRALFDVVLAAHIDAVLQTVVQLHRSAREPEYVVYGTPEQLQRVLAWVAAKVVALPLLRETCGGVNVVPRAGEDEESASAAQCGDTTRSKSKSKATGGQPPAPPTRTATPEVMQRIISSDSMVPQGSEDVEDSEGDGVSAPHALPATARSPAELLVWQSRCLQLLVPPIILHGPSTTATSTSGVADPPNQPHRHSTAGRASTDDLFTHDQLSCFFLLGDGTFLHSLLHSVHRSCTSPTSMELLFRAPQQLTLLTATATRFCSSTTLSSPPVLQLVLRYLLRWLIVRRTSETRREVCAALLYVWPVAVSAVERMKKQTRQDTVARLNDGASWGSPTDWRSDRLESELRACAVLLARAMEPLVTVSPLVGSTWRALCRSDPKLRRCEWQRRAATFRAQTERRQRDMAGDAVSGRPSQKCRNTYKNGGLYEDEENTRREEQRGHDVVDVDDSESEDGSVARHHTTDAQNEEVEQHLWQLCASSMPPKMESWGKATYVLYRAVCLAPLQLASAQSMLRVLCGLLAHTCGMDAIHIVEGVNDDDSAETAGTTSRGRKSRCDSASSAELVDSVWTGDDRLGGGNTAVFSSPPPAVFLRDVAAGVDSLRDLVVRCLHVAAALARHGDCGAASINTTTQDGQGELAEEASRRRAEQTSVALQRLVRCSIRVLYRWCTAATSNSASAVADDSTAPAADDDMSTTFASWSSADISAGGDEGSEEHAAACFQLLRSLSLCVVYAGQARTLTHLTTAAATTTTMINFAAEDDAENGSGFPLSSSGDAILHAVAGGEGELMHDAASAEQLVAASLGHAYARQLHELEQLCWSAEALTAEAATRTLRVWAACFSVSTQTATAGTLSPFDAAVVHLLCDRSRVQIEQQQQSRTTRAESEATEYGAEKCGKESDQLCVAYAPFLLRPLTWVLRSSSCGDSNTYPEISAVNAPAGKGMSLTDPFVWQPLRADPPDQRTFLSRFVSVMAGVYGMTKKSTLWASLLSLIHVGPQDQSTTSSSALSTDFQTFRLSAHLLGPLLLHVMCLRESESQRAMRAAWSELLDRHVVCQAQRCPDVARLFLQALHTCHAVLMRRTRERGVKGFAARGQNAAGNPKAVTFAGSALASAAGATTSTAQQQQLQQQQHCLLSWPTAFGAVPTLADMQESYWLSDIAAVHLARAATVVQEPYLALVFAQLSGESLFGPHTGSAAMCGKAETTRTVVMLREGTVAGTSSSADGGRSAASVNSAPFSVLFPLTRSEDGAATASAATDAVAGGGGSEARARGGGRARERQENIRLQTRRFMRNIFDVYAAVQAQVEVDDVTGPSVMARQLDDSFFAAAGEGAEDAMSAGIIARTSFGGIGAAHDGVSGTVIRKGAAPSSYVSPSEQTASGAQQNSSSDLSGDGEESWMNAMRSLEEKDEDDLFQLRAAAQAGAAVPSGDVWWPALQRAAKLLQRGLATTAIDTLLSLSRRVSDSAKRSFLKDATTQPTRDGGGTTAAAVGCTWTSRHESSLRSLLAQAAWRCAQWSTIATTLPSSPTDDLDNTQTGGDEELAARILNHNSANKSSSSSGGGENGRAMRSLLSAVSPAVLERLAPSSTSPYLPSGGTGTLHDGGFYEHLLNAFVALSARDAVQCLSAVRSAERALRCELVPSSVVSAVVAAEALDEVRQCAISFLHTSRQKVSLTAGTDRRPHSASVCPVKVPAWLMPTSMTHPSTATTTLHQSGAKKSAVRTYCSAGSCRMSSEDVCSQLGSQTWQLTDSVRCALTHLYSSSEASFQFLMGATERALLFREPALAQHWLRGWQQQRRLEHASEHASVARFVLSDEQRMDLLLRTAQVCYATGQWQEALALLQPPATQSSSKPDAAGHRASHNNDEVNWEDLLRARRLVPHEPRVVQQLMRWHSELHLLPPSQIIRDPFLSRAAAGDVTGACSFVLARHCHLLATDIADRMNSHEHQQLEASVAASRQRRGELEAQLHAATQAVSAMTRSATAAETDKDDPLAAAAAARKSARLHPPVDGAGAAAPVVLSEEQMKLLRRRIRELSSDIRRLEEEWEVARQNYQLYRRSALNSYSRYLQLCPRSSSSSNTFAAAGNPQEQQQKQRGGQVRCVPSDDEENTVQAIFGFVELWLNAAEWDTGLTDMLARVIDRSIERIPTAVFLPLASQLTAQLGSPQGGGRLRVLVTRVARDYPMHLVWPLLALYHGHTFAKSRDVNTLHGVDETKIKLAQRILTELMTPPTAISSTTSKQPQQEGEVSAAAAAALVAKQIHEAKVLSAAYLELAFDRSGTAMQTDKQYTIRSDFMLLKEARHLHIPPPTAVNAYTADNISLAALASAASTGTGASTLRDISCCASVVPHVVRYRPYFTTPGGVNVPKVLLCELSDGQVCRQLLKAGDDLRQDALIEQVFSTANQLFHRRATTRPLRIRTFTIVPLAPTAGILQWVEHTLPLGEYVAGRFNGREEVPGAHERYFPTECNTRECRIQLTSAAASQRPETLLHLYQRYTPALHYFFLEEFTSAEACVQRQQTFTRSVAVSSMVGYLVGLGDRHINNILLHRRTAEVVHIDLGIAFDQGKLLPTPELVPFRMTRNIIDGLGVRGTEGSLLPCAEAAMQLLREKRELLRILLSSITHDPLARWVVGTGGANGAPGGGVAEVAMVEGDPGNAEAQQLQGSARQLAPLRAQASSADAARTLARIDAKLRGFEDGDQLSVSTQVRKLVEEAQRVELLAVMFPGWSQWV